MVVGLDRLLLRAYKGVFEGLDQGAGRVAWVAF